MDWRRFWKGRAGDAAEGIRQSDRAVRELSELAQGLNRLMAELDLAAGGPGGSAGRGRNSPDLARPESGARAFLPSPASRQ